MTKRFPATIVLICASVAAACGSDRALEPELRPVFTSLEVTPVVADLLTVAPGNTVQLSFQAWGLAGVRLPATNAPTYSSSDPAIAQVSNDGVVTAAAPGIAEITVALTVEGITRTTSMTARVHRDGNATDEYPEIAGVYDLTALITSSDPAWGIPDGTRQTAVIAIEHSGNGRLGGTFARFCAIGPDGEFCNETPGVVSGTVDTNGRVVLELTFAGSQSSYWYGEGTLVSREIVGEFGAGGHISGTFTARLRQAK